MSRNHYSPFPYFIVPVIMIPLITLPAIINNVRNNKKDLEACIEKGMEVQFVRDFPERQSPDLTPQDLQAFEEVKQIYLSGKGKKSEYFSPQEVSYFVQQGQEARKTVESHCEKDSSKYK